MCFRKSLTILTVLVPVLRFVVGLGVHQYLPLLSLIDVPVVGEGQARTSIEDFLGME